MLISAAESEQLAVPFEGLGISQGLLRLEQDVKMEMIAAARLSESELICLKPST